MYVAHATQFLHFVLHIDKRNLDPFRRDKLVNVFHFFFMLTREQK